MTHYRNIIESTSAMKALSFLQARGLTALFEFPLPDESLLEVLSVQQGDQASAAC